MYDLLDVVGVHDVVVVGRPVPAVLLQRHRPRPSLALARVPPVLSAIQLIDRVESNAVEI